MIPEVLLPGWVVLSPMVVMLSGKDWAFTEPGDTLSPFLPAHLLFFLPVAS